MYVLFLIYVWRKGFRRVVAYRCNCKTHSPAKLYQGYGLAYEIVAKLYPEYGLAYGIIANP